MSDLIGTIITIGVNLAQKVPIRRESIDKTKMIIAMIYTILAIADPQEIAHTKIKDSEVKGGQEIEMDGRTIHTIVEAVRISVMIEGEVGVTMKEKTATSIYLGAMQDRPEKIILHQLSLALMAPHQPLQRCQEAPSIAILMDPPV
jgi:hypothetical protein